MKFLELNLDDDELFDMYYFDDIDYLQSKMSEFKRLYHDQGEEFWLRHLLTLREHLHILIRARFEHEHNQCVHWIINPLDKMFIRIYKLFFANGFESAKRSLTHIKKVLLNAEVLLPVIMYEKYFSDYPHYPKLAHKSLFGSDSLSTTAGSFKIYLACGLYQYFCKTLAVLLERYEETETALKSSTECQYWKPFPFWKNKSFKAQLFENYIARLYKERLSEMLLTPNVHLIFQAKHIPQCCSMFIKDYSSRLFKNEVLYRTEYTPCPLHNRCFRRRVHAESCKNPYSSCTQKNPCDVICDTIWDDSYDEDDFWKRHLVTVHKSSRKNCRDVSTLSETRDCDKNVANYILRRTSPVQYDYEWNIEIDELPLPDDLPPEFINVTKQINQKEKTKSRLRSKLLKKSTFCDIDNLSINSTRLKETNVFKIHKHRKHLLHQAQIQFHKELGDELLCKILTGKMKKFSELLISLFETNFEITDLCPDRINSKYRSIGVGSSSPLFLQFSDGPKIMHINKRLQIKYNVPYTLEINTNESTANVCSTAAAETDPNGKHLNNTKKKKQTKKSKKKITCTESCNDIPSTITPTDMTINNLTDIKKEKVDNSMELCSSEIQNKMETTLKNSQHSQNIKQKIPEKDEPKKFNSIDKNDELCSIKYSPNSRIKRKSVIPKVESFSDENAAGVELVKDKNTCNNVFTKLIQHKDEIKIACDATDKEMKLTELSENVSEKSKVNAINGHKRKLPKIRTCSLCDQLEEIRKSFKKCKLCKDQNTKKPRYYCSRNCQLKDWKETHQYEHENLLSVD